jgi:hypothetical protein
VLKQQEELSMTVEVYKWTEGPVTNTKTLEDCALAWKLHKKYQDDKAARKYMLAELGKGKPVMFRHAYQGGQSETVYVHPDGRVRRVSLYPAKTMTLGTYGTGLGPYTAQHNDKPLGADYGKA